MQITRPQLRLDLVTASRVDLALILLPEIGWLQASVMLAASGVPAEVAARVLALPLKRRGIADQGEDVTN